MPTLIFLAKGHGQSMGQFTIYDILSIYDPSLLGCIIFVHLAMHISFPYVLRRLRSSLQSLRRSPGVFHIHNHIKRKSFIQTYSSMGEAGKIEAGKTRVGWIGTGVMGQAMCAHVLSAGYALTVFNRTPSKAQTLCDKGALMADSPKSVATRSDVVFTIVGYPADVRQVIMGENGILEGLRPGGIVVDMTTSEPSLAREIFTAAKEKGIESVDAPVSGGDKGAKAGTLAIFAGGEEDVVEKLRPLFNCMGKVTYMGGPGLGQCTKLGNQITIASTMVGLVEGMVYAHKAGLDVPLYIKAISTGAAGSKSLDLNANRILKRDFDPGFFVNHFVKDLGISLRECQQMGLSLPGLALAQQLYVSLKAHGEGNLGTQALVLALERLNNVQLPTINGL